VSVTLVGENDAPVYEGGFAFTLNASGSHVFSSDEMRATDPDNAPEDVVYNVVTVQGGELLVDGQVASTFTQADIDAARVEFVMDPNNASGAPMTLTVTVDDQNEDESTPEPFVLRFDPLVTSQLQFVEDDTIKTTGTVTTLIAVSALLANDVDTAGETISISSMNAQSEYGGTVTFDGQTVTYNAPDGFVGIDRIFYTLTNQSGDVVEGYISIDVAADSSGSGKTSGFAIDEFLGVVTESEAHVDASGGLAVSSSPEGPASEPGITVGLAAQEGFPWTEHPIADGGIAPVIDDQQRLEEAMLTRGGVPSEHSAADDVTTATDSERADLMALSPFSDLGADTGADEVAHRSEEADAYWTIAPNETEAGTLVSYLSGDLIDFGGLDSAIANPSVQAQAVRGPGDAMASQGALADLSLDDVLEPAETLESLWFEPEPQTEVATYALDAPLIDASQLTGDALQLERGMLGDILQWEDGGNLWV